MSSSASCPHRRLPLVATPAAQATTIVNGCVSTSTRLRCIVSFFFLIFLTLVLSSFWTSRGHRCRPFCPRVLPSIFIAHRVQQSHCSSIFHRMLLTHALALSASEFVHKKKSQRIYTSMHTAGLELTKLTYTRLEDNLTGACHISYRYEPASSVRGGSTTMIASCVTIEVDVLSYCTLLCVVVV